MKWWVLNGWILPSGRIPSVRVCFKKEATPEEKNHTEYTPNRCIFYPIRSSGLQHIWRFKRKKLDFKMKNTEHDIDLENTVRE